MSFFHRFRYKRTPVVIKGHNFMLYEQRLTWFGRWRLRRLAKKLDRGIKKAVMEGRLKL